ncbi:MAG: SEL1-like repeat protein [Chryseobacterium sp.]|nr:SEL1-like repeat protein [Chryseobacterium sp.]
MVERVITMKFCPNCQKDFDDKFIFCHYCGGKLQEKIKLIFCPYCGNKIETDGQFCPYCGNILNGSEVTSCLLQGEEELRLGIQLEKGKEYSDSFNHFKKAVKMGFDEAIIWYITSPAFEEEKAKADIEKIVEIAEKAYNTPFKFEETYKKCNKLADLLGYNFFSDKIGKQLSFKWRKFAADNGDVSAMHNIGINYSSGIGTEIDIEKAIEYYLKAAEKGLLTTNLPGCYERKKDYKKALEWYEKLAALDPNNYWSWYKIGEMYQKGLGTEKDFKKAIYWYKKALESPEYANTCYMLGEMYENGEGVEQSYSKAMMYFYEASDDRKSASINAKYKLGVMYYEGKVLAKDLNKAETFLHEAVDKGITEAKNLLDSVITIKENNLNTLKQKQDYYKNLAEQGNSNAQCWLGNIYLNGEGCQKDYGEALNWYYKASENGNLEAICQLGKIFKNGYGVSKDLTKAKRYFQYAANQGFADAQYNLGLLLHEEECKRSAVSMNNEALLYLFENAAKQGHADAQCFLGSEYLFGVGTSSVKVKDPQKAVFWYQKAVERNSLEAQYQLGVFYYNGKYVKKDKQKGYDLILKSAKAGHVTAQLFLAGMTGNIELHGRNLEEDDAFDEAYLWCRKLAEEGHLYSQCKLGKMYENGKPICKKYRKAFIWYTKASEAGNGYALYLLGNLYYNGHGVKKDETKAEELYHKAAEKDCEDAEFALKRIEKERKKKELELKKSQHETLFLSSITPQIIKLTLDVALSDNNWRQCGFKEGCPKRGKIFKFFIKKEQLVTESYLFREFIAIPLGIFVRNLYFAIDLNYKEYISYLVNILLSIEGMEDLVKPQLGSARGILETSILSYAAAENTYEEFIKTSSIYPDKIKPGVKPICTELNRLLTQKVKDLNENYYIEDDITT